jgi:hypothetical protein
MFKLPHIRFVQLRISAVSLLLLSSVGVAGAASGSATPRCDPLTDFRQYDFPQPTTIDNQWYGLIPGTQFIMDGTINVGTTTTAHRVVFTVTDLTKVINGVKTRVLWDTDTNNGQLAESELAFQAQDTDGNVWVLGEYPEEYENGVFVGAPSTWISGLRNAVAGVLVPGHPATGTPPFIEAKALNIKFWDCGQVSATSQTISGPQNSYDNVLVINEWGPLDPAGGIQQKYYAPGVGLVQIGALNDPQAETLTLTRRVQLSPRALAEVREEALKLERRAYEVSDVYRKTSAAEVAH